MKAVKDRWVLIPVIAISLVVGAIVPFAVQSVIGHLMYRYTSSPERESAFLRSYDPRPVIQPFIKHPGGTGDGGGSSSGWKSVSNERQTDATFAIQADMGNSLMNALSEDIAAQLTRDGATILSRSGDLARGFHFAYKDGTSVGKVTLLPLSDRTWPSTNPPLAPGLKFITAHIDISEKWFAQEPDAVKASKDLR